MTSDSANHTLSRAEFRQIAIRTQLLDQTQDLSISQVLEQAGFVRALGGVDVYLALRARISKLTRVQLDEAVEARAVQVIPAARNCIYLVSQRDVPHALTFAQQQRATRDSREHEKAGIRPDELEELGQVIETTLRQQERSSTTQLRKRLPEGSYRSLGTAGKKIGISSTLPPALRMLEFAGRIERFFGRDEIRQ